MSPEEKERINKLLKEVGGNHTVDELEVIRKRAFRTLEEWSSQDAASRAALPQDVQDMKMIARYSLYMALSGMVPLIAALGTRWKWSLKPHIASEKLPRRLDNRVGCGIIPQ